MKKKNIVLLTLFIALFSASIQADLSYKVQISGVKEPKLKEALKASSQLLNFSEHTAASMGVLKRRGETDIANFVKVLHGLAYYNATVNYTIDSRTDPVEITFYVVSGLEYPLAEFSITSASLESNTLETFSYDQITLSDLGITLGVPAYAEVILQAEEKLLQIMAQRGYPHASIKKRLVVADQEKKDLHVKLIVDSGPLAHFGAIAISGNNTVKEELFYKKIAWQEGKPFNLKDIQATQEALEASGLFSSTVISQGELDPVTGELPIEIQVNEAKHRSVAGGLSYMTQRGAGIMGEWDHRNVRGIGEKINLRANLWQDTQDGRISYILPDFKKNQQDLVLLGEVEHERIKAYTESSLSLSAILDRKISTRLKISYGLMYKSILIRDTDDNGSFQLLKVPMQLRWSAANSLLDPTSGYTVYLKVAPTVQLKAPSFVYCPTTFTGTCYLPFTDDQRFVLAAKGIVGSIIGTSRRTIPSSERFFAGTENTLRGYNYLTVSPLKCHRDPIGGLSMMVLSLEGRIRLSEKLGLVGFYEIGNVYSSSVPQFAHKQLQSAGVGIRYHTPIGPIRFDIAVPINRRYKVDSPFQAYISIGQSF